MANDINRAGNFNSEADFVYGVMLQDGTLTESDVFNMICAWQAVRAKQRAHRRLEIIRAQSDLDAKTPVRREKKVYPKKAY